MSFFDQLSAKVNQGFNQVASQTKDFTDQVKIENEIKNLEKAVNACYEELGRAMYNASRNPSDTPAKYEETMQKIDGILQQIQEKKESKQEIANKVICPSCGKSVPAGTKCCNFCGAMITPTEPVSPAEEAPTAPVHNEEKHCPSCGGVIPAGSIFCTQCGARITDTEILSAPEPADVIKTEDTETEEKPEA